MQTVVIPSFTTVGTHWTVPVGVTSDDIIVSVAMVEVVTVVAVAVAILIGHYRFIIGSIL